MSRNEAHLDQRRPSERDRPARKGRDHSDLEGTGQRPGSRFEENSLTVTEIVRLYAADSANQDLLQRAARLPGLPESWREYFRRRLWEPGRLIAMSASYSRPTTDRKHDD